MGHSGVFLPNGFTPPTEKKQRCARATKMGRDHAYVPEEQGTDTLKSVHEQVKWQVVLVAFPK
jgi:hypothetical protein